MPTSIPFKMLLNCICRLYLLNAMMEYVLFFINIFHKAAGSPLLYSLWIEITYFLCEQISTVTEVFHFLFIYPILQRNARISYEVWATKKLIPSALSIVLLSSRFSRLATLRGDHSADRDNTRALQHTFVFQPLWRVALLLLSEPQPRLSQQRYDSPSVLKRQS